MHAPAAEFTRHSDKVRATLKRFFDHGPSEVWSMLTDPEKLPDWLASGRIDPFVGGRAQLDFQDSGIRIDSRVSAYQPMQVLEYSWSSGDEPLRPVRWSLRPQYEGTALTLELTTPASEDMGRSCAGWEAHLAMLEAALEGVPIKFPFPVFAAARDAYRVQLAA